MSVDIQGIQGGLRRAEMLVRLSIVDENDRERASLAAGYYDSSGHAIGGNGAIAIRKGDQIQIQSWGLVAQTLLAVGKILPNVYQQGGWTGVSEDSLSGRGRIVLNVDETVDDSDKTYTVPTNLRVKVKSIWIDYTANATVGTRLVDVEFRNAGAFVFGGYRLWPAGLTATQTGRAWLFNLGGGGRVAQDALRSTLAGGPVHSDMGPLPDMDLPQAYDIRIDDKADIAVAVPDDMLTRIFTEEWIEE